MRGPLWGTQYRNTVQKNGKYRSTVANMDEIPIPHLCFFFFISSMYTPHINLSLREKTCEDLELIGTAIEKPGHWMSYHIIE